MTVKKKTVKVLKQVVTKPTLKTKTVNIVTKNVSKVKQVVVNSVDSAVKKVVNLATIQSNKVDPLSSESLPAVKLKSRVMLNDLTEHVRVNKYTDLKMYKGPLHNARKHLILDTTRFYWFSVTYQTDYSAPTTSNNFLAKYGISYTRVASPFECFGRWTFNKGLKLIAFRVRSGDASPFTYEYVYEIGMNPLITTEEPLSSSISDMADGGYDDVDGRLHYFTFLISDANPFFAYFSSLGILKAIDLSQTSIVTNYSADTKGKVCDIGWITKELKTPKYI